MGIQKILNKEALYGVPVKIFTQDIDSESIEQLKKNGSAAIHLFSHCSYA